MELLLLGHHAVAYTRDLQLDRDEVAVRLEAAHMCSTIVHRCTASLS